MEANPDVVVHLVHGTWPFGIFRRSPGRIKAWFEAGSPVLANIEELVGHRLQFKDFRWSGKNTFFERTNAAGKFGQRPAETIAQDAGAKHIVIGHSHGGSIAAHALASLSADERDKIKALVCLATPFVYLSSLKKPREDLLFFGALGFICTALLPILLQLSLDLHYLLYLLLSPCAPIFFIGILLLFRVDPPLEYFAPLSGHSDIPTFMIRGTRDEASLVIGLLQILHLATDAFYRSWEGTPADRSLINMALRACAYGFVLGAGILLTK